MSVATLKLPFQVVVPASLDHIDVPLGPPSKRPLPRSSLPAGCAKTRLCTQVAFLLPTLIIVLLYVSIIFLHLYHYRRWLRDAYARDFWDGARYTLALLWCGHAWIWHSERSFFPRGSNVGQTEYHEI